MTTLYLRPGTTVEYNNTGSAISSGDVVIMDKTVGIATVDIGATTGVGTVAIEGVYTLPKANTAAMALGALVDWDASAGTFITTVGTPASGDIVDVALCMKAAASGDTTAELRLVIGIGTKTA